MILFYTPTVYYWLNVQYYHSLARENDSSSDPGNRFLPKKNIYFSNSERECSEYQYEWSIIDRMNRNHSEIYYMCTNCRHYFRNFQVVQSLLLPNHSFANQQLVDDQSSIIEDRATEGSSLFLSVQMYRYQTAKDTDDLCKSTGESCNLLSPLPLSKPNSLFHCAMRNTKDAEF